MEIESALFDKMKKEAKIRSHCHWFLSEKLDCGNKYFTNDYIYIFHIYFLHISRNSKANILMQLIIFNNKNTLSNIRISSTPAHVF
jgi:hypothetical protein